MSCHLDAELHHWPTPITVLIIIIITNHGDTIDIPTRSTKESSSVWEHVDSRALTLVIVTWMSSHMTDPYLALSEPSLEALITAHSVPNTIKFPFHSRDLYFCGSSLCVLVSCPLMVLKLYVHYTNLIVYCFSFSLCSISLVVSMKSMSFTCVKMWKKECKAISVLQKWRLTVLSLCSRTWSRSWTFCGIK